jgi:integrase/recombinase XerD
MTTRIPLVLKYPDWPEADQQAWDQLLTGPIRFGRAQPEVAWVDGTRHIRAQGYGQWLSYLKRKHPQVLNLPPSERITLPNVEAFLLECEARLKPRSVHNVLLSIAVLAQRWAPRTDWDWLWAAVANQRHSFDRYELRHPPPVSADHIFAAALGALRVTLAAPDLLTLSGAVRFRQELLMALLISCPVRIRAVGAMTVSYHVAKGSDGFSLRFRAEDMKDQKARSFVLADALVEPVLFYLDVIRPVLCRGSAIDAFWVSRNGSAIKCGDLSKELYKTTKRLLGVGMHAHAFRHVERWLRKSEQPG